MANGFALVQGILEENQRLFRVYKAAKWKAFRLYSERRESRREGGSEVREDGKTRLDGARVRKETLPAHGDTLARMRASWKRWRPVCDRDEEQGQRARGSEGRGAREEESGERRTVNSSFYVGSC